LQPCGPGFITILDIAEKCHRCDDNRTCGYSENLVIAAKIAVVEHFLKTLLMINMIDHRENFPEKLFYSKKKIKKNQTTSMIKTQVTLSSRLPFQLYLQKILN